MAESLSRCFCIFWKHALGISTCLRAFQALLIPPSWRSGCLLDGYVFELKHRLQLHSSLDVKFSSVVLSQSTVLLGEEMEMSLCRPLREDLNDLNEEVLGESGLPRLENKICVVTVDEFPGRLSRGGEYRGVLGPGLWRFVARITYLPPYSSTVLATDGIPVMSDDRGLSMSLSGTPFLFCPTL